MTTSLELEDFARQIDSVNASARALVDNHSLEALTRPSTTGGWSPAIFRPGIQPCVQTALNALLHRHAERQTLRQLADGLDLAAIRVTSPASAKLKLPVGAVFGILTAHARRHLWQARRGLNES